MGLLPRLPTPDDRKKIFNIAGHYYSSSRDRPLKKHLIVTPAQILIFRGRNNVMPLFS